VIGSPRRALVAAGLLAALLAALLGAWFAAGWAGVRDRQRAVRDAPWRTAEQRAAELAHELRGELAQVMAREVERPYFHYQNLFHDPRASAVSVAPSPLAQGARDPLVLGHFQLDARGHTTTPTINDELPELSDAARLADNRRFRDEVARSLAGPLAPPAAGPLVASLTPTAVQQVQRPARQRPPVPPVQAAQKPVPEQAQAQAQAVPRGKTKVVQIDPSTYAQNNASNDIYIQQRRVPAQSSNEPGEQRRVPVQSPRDTAASNAGIEQVRGSANAVPENAGNSEARQPPRSAQPRPDPAAGNPGIGRGAESRGVPVVDPARPVTITVSPLEWRTLRFAGQPSLVAVRQVETPDGRLAQGFVVDRTALTGWLAGRAGDAVAELRTGDGGAAEIAPGWQLAVSPNPRAVIAAAADAGGVARDFVLRFLAVGLVALLVAVLVVVVVVRAERLARERSQFAAAAAHELRTPLAGLQLYGDMLADGLGDPAKLRDYARRMSEEAARLGRVVSNVLGFSQLQRGNLSVEPQVARLTDALRELAERAQPALDRAGAALALDVDGELSARFDRDALARIIGNLLDNAEKYSRQAADRTITLAAHPAGGAVEIVVTDRGPGIAAATGARLFRPFTRGVSGDGPAGLGLGLALSQSLARAMGGELSHRPAPAGGAAFVLRLPPA